MNVIQIAVNSLYGAAVYALCAIGFALVYRTARFFNFAHGFSIIAGPYAAYALKTWLGCPLLLAVVGGVAFACAIGCLLEVGLFRPMRDRHATPLTLLLASLGAYVVLQNVVSLVFGDHTRILRIVQRATVWQLFGARLTGIQALTVFVALISIAGLLIFVRRTRAGRAIRAVSDDAELADMCGIDSRRVMLWVLGTGSGLAGLAGILVGLDVDITPSMGLPYLMMTVVVVIIGGKRRIDGVLYGACFLSVAQNIGIWIMGAQWRDAIAFAVLLVFLIVRAQRWPRPVRQATRSDV